MFKKASIAVGLYGQARRFYRRFVNPAQAEQLRSEAAFYRRLIGPPRPMAFDAGANIGEKSEALLLAGYDVVAFEPQADCFRELVARCSRFGDRFTAVPAALGAAPGEATLYIGKQRGQSSLSREWNPRDVVGEVRVPVTTLDEQIARWGAPEFIKIDVEGHELDVLRGLSRHVPLVSLEYHLRDHGEREAFACLDSLARFGDVEVNITPMEDLEFAWPHFVPLDEFKRRFPGEFLDRSGFFYGDLFAKIG